MEPSPLALRSSLIEALPRPKRIALAAILAVGFALITDVVGLASGAPMRYLVIDTTIGLTFIGAGVIAWLRRPEVLTGPLLLLCGPLGFVGSYAPTAHPILMHLGFAFEGYQDVALAALVLALPGRLPRGWSRTVVVALGATFLMRSLARLMLQDPPTMYAEVCPGCPSNPFAVAPNRLLFEAIETWASVVVVGLALGVAMLCLRRLLLARPLARRVLWPILVGGVIAMLAAGLDAAETAYGTATGLPLLTLAEPWDEVFAWSLVAARLMVPIAFLVGSLRLRVAGGSLVALAVGLGRVPSPVRLQSALGAALGDPAVRLVRPDPDGRGWVTADGRRTTQPSEDAEHAVTMLEHDGRPLAAIVHDPVLREDPALVGSVMAVLRLAVENERLDAALQAQLETMHASRARLVQAGEEERRRLERDLHDGAQQRLVAVTMELQQARQAAESAGSPELRDRLTSVADELQAAINELRELARGLHPALLENEGLAAAVAALARRSNVPVDLKVEVERRMPRAVESAAYFTVAECLTNIARHAGAGRASIRLVDDGDRLIVEVDDDGVGGADVTRGTGLRGLADRLGALDGRLEVRSQPGGGTRVRAEIPIQ